ncbi:iron hydrogenase [Schizopora paradoxa]|uniref:Iron hydrogenase n=1 Tax=Schizopora paradoxa TaxID=27342 RepID=A0A0H2RNQ9_9AGAM|nr:iron hydrogenase [Schizopora paradoxa]
MAFSGALTLTDLNDFITPSQACIKPVEQTNKPQEVENRGDASTEIRIDSAGSYYEVSSGASSSRKLEVAQISLNDCLACSGCITSAESVLITMQSHEEVMGVLSANPPKEKEGHRVPVISISPQSLASFAANVSSSSATGPSVTLRQMLSRIRAFCTEELGFEHVYDTTFARHISLLEHVQEFRERKGASRLNEGAARLPMLASACPGWVCYAEKTHAEMLPFISRTKSPQQVMGTLVKSWLGHKWGKNPDEIYHVTVMPCYDKKLEASRSDFYNDVYSTRDVDCVITTSELELLMRERGWDLSLPVPSENMRPESHSCEFPELLGHPGSSSGSYLSSLVSEFSSSETELSTKTIRSSDYEEYTLTNKRTNEVVFRGARCYGFRNLQNVVRKVGRDAGVGTSRGAAGRLANVRAKRGAKAGGTDAVGSSSYDYVEVMACPSGCVNGGGQLKPPLGFASGVTSSESSTISDDNAARWGNKEWTKRVEQAYWHDLPTPPPSPTPTDTDQFPTTSISDGKTSHLLADKLAVQILSDLCEQQGIIYWSDTMGENGEGLRKKFFRTEYRAVESEVLGIQVKW